MDDIYYVLVSMDYPDAMTGGLRRIDRRRALDHGAHARRPLVDAGSAEHRRHDGRATARARPAS